MALKKSSISEFTATSDRGDSGGSSVSDVSGAQHKVAAKPKLKYVDPRGTNGTLEIGSRESPVKPSRGIGETRTCAS